MCWVNEMRLSALFVADSLSHQLLVWFDGFGFDLPLPLPRPQPRSIGWGGIARGADNAFYVTRPGDGKNGAVLRVPDEGPTIQLANLDASRQRTGIVCLPDGSLLTTFVGARWDIRTGGVSRIDANGHETVLVRGLTRPLDLAVIGNVAYVSDEETHGIFSFLLDDPAPRLTLVASVPRAGYLCAGPNGTLFVTGSDGRVFRLCPRGRVSLFETGLGSPRGIACDPVEGRVFVIARAPDRPRDSALFVVSL